MKSWASSKNKVSLFFLFFITTITIMQIPNSHASNIKKKDGTVDQRENDLDELCKDWVYYKAKILKYTKEGDEKAAAKARNNFNAVNKDLSEYRDSDVSAICTKYDTRENIQKYLR